MMYPKDVNVIMARSMVIRRRDVVVDIDVDADVDFFVVDVDVLLGSLPPCLLPLLFALSSLSWLFVPVNVDGAGAAQIQFNLAKPNPIQTNPNPMPHIFSFRIPIWPYVSISILFPLCAFFF